LSQAACQSMEAKEPEFNEASWHEGAIS